MTKRIFFIFCEFVKLYPCKVIAIFRGKIDRRVA
jgi:hypothetical protein